jgi:hypothetical protein
MHFIEQLFGVSPDGGSGVLEFYLVLVPLGLVAVWAILRRAAYRGGTEIGRHRI